jgi:hypothetical protein
MTKRESIEFKFGETDGVINLAEYPYQANWYIWTWPKDLDFDKAISELIGQEVKLVDQGGGNGHEYGTFITLKEFNLTRCKYGIKKDPLGFNCYQCKRDDEEAKITFEDIKACPFCGWDNKFNTNQVQLEVKTKTVNRYDGPRTKFYIECSICGTTGPMLSETDKGAILDWNLRREPLINRFKHVKAE